MVGFPISGRIILKYGAYQMEVLIRENRVCDRAKFKSNFRFHLSVILGLTKSRGTFRVQSNI